MAQKRLARSATNRIISGVCGGISEYTHIPSWIIRLITIILFFVPVPVILVTILYILLTMALPVRIPGKQLESDAIDVEYEVRE